ncbi:unnamed protein product [Sympodiomycopsis kandeliae]
MGRKKTYAVAPKGRAPCPSVLIPDNNNFFPCPLIGDCDKILSSAASLRAHISSVHAPDDEELLAKVRTARWTSEYGILTNQASAFALYIRDTQRRKPFQDLKKETGQDLKSEAPPPSWLLKWENEMAQRWKEDKQLVAKFQQQWRKESYQRAAKYAASKGGNNKDSGQADAAASIGISGAGSQVGHEGNTSDGNVGLVQPPASARKRKSWDRRSHKACRDWIKIGRGCKVDRALRHQMLRSRSPHRSRSQAQNLRHLLHWPSHLGQKTTRAANQSRLDTSSVSPRTSGSTGEDHLSLPRTLSSVDPQDSITLASPSARHTPWTDNGETVLYE